MTPLLTCDSPRQQVPSNAVSVPSTALLGEALPFDVQADGIWRCCDSDWANRVSQVEEFVTQPQLPNGCVLLKQQADKRVWLWQDASIGQSRTIVKMTARLKPRLRFWLRRRLDSESFNLVCAERRGLHVPRLYACGTWGWWFCRRRVVNCLEYFPWPNLLDQLSAPCDEAEQWRLMRRVSKLLCQLHEAGCVHIDFGPHNILLSPDATADDVLIDWENAGFPVHPSDDVFAAQAGYFSWLTVTSQHLVSPSLIEAWFAELLAELRFANPNRQWSIWRRNLLKRESSRRRMAWC